MGTVDQVVATAFRGIDHDLPSIMDGRDGKNLALFPRLVSRRFLVNTARKMNAKLVAAQH
jgi:hypothetical protein